MSRPETGPMQFGDDWPGVFIRGDNAAYFAMALDEVMQLMTEMGAENRIGYFALAGLRSTLASCDARTAYDIQRMRAWSECAPTPTGDGKVEP